MTEVNEKVLRYARIGVEEEFGIEVTDEEQLIDVDIASIGLDAPSDPVMRYNGGLSRSTHTSRPGPYIPSGNIEYAFDVQSIAHILYMAFGQMQTNEGDLVTAEDGDTTYVDGQDELHEHIFAPLRHSLTLPSGTFRLGKDHFEHVFTGVTINSVEFSMDNDFAFVTIDVSAQKDGKDDIEEIEDLKLSTAYPVAFYETSVEIGKVGEEQEEVANVESLSLTLSNNIDADSGISLGSRYPQRIIAGDFEASGSMDIAYEGTEQLEHFWGGEDGPDDDAQDELNINFRFKSAPYMTEIEDGETTEEVEIRDAELDLHVPKVLYETVNIQPSGRDRTTQSVDFRAYYDEDSSYELIAHLYNEIDYISEYTAIESTTIQE